MNKYFKKINIVSLSLFLLFFIVMSVNAAILKDTKNLDPTEPTNETGKFITATGLETGTDIGNIAAVGIKAFLGLLGIIFLFLLVLAGYKYMIARGDESKVEESLSIMRRAIVGLIIVMLAYSATYFVFSHLDGGSGVETGAGDVE